MTRAEWVEKARLAMEGAFEHVRSIDDPIIPCAAETTKEKRKKRGASAGPDALAEALVRTFCLAAVLIREDPAAVCRGISLRDYYAKWIPRVCAPKKAGDPYAAGLYEERPDEVQQMTVEAGLLVIALWISEDALWRSIPPDVRDSLAVFLRSQADGRTVMQNWRLFNLLIYAFLDRYGYGCPKERVRFLAEEVRIDYAGDGWYRDGQSFDYYTAWAYQVFLPIWNLWYGYEREPDLAAKFEQRCRLFVKTYVSFFDREGRMTLWGRSGLYRAAAGVPLISTFLMPGDPGVPAGRAREILDGLIGQFESRMGRSTGRMLPCGFYEAFPPMTQGYSREGSPYWASMVFWRLLFPQEHPLWAGDSEAAVPEKTGSAQPVTTVLDGPGIAVTAFPKSGSVCLRTGKVIRSGDLDSYAKLAYHSDLLWGTEVRRDGLIVEPMQYRLYAGKRFGTRTKVRAFLKKRELRTDSRVNAVAWSGERGGVLLRRAFFEFSPRTAWEWLYSILLADVAMPEGILRADRLRCPERDFSLALGSFSIPGAVFETETAEDKETEARAIIVKAELPDGRSHQLAMTVYGGWDDFDVIRSEGTTPDLMPCLTIWGRRRITDTNRSELLISQVLYRKGCEPFEREALFPILAVPSGAVPVLTLRDGRAVGLPYDETSGALSL